MAIITITEGLAEMKLISDKIAKKRKTILDVLAYPDTQADPLAKRGGNSKDFVTNERQAVEDLMKRHVKIRLAINKSNLVTMIRVGDKEQSAAEWLIWRREISEAHTEFLNNMKRKIDSERNSSQIRSSERQRAIQAENVMKAVDINVNCDEQGLWAEIEKQSETLAALDGQFSLKDATTTIDV